MSVRAEIENKQTNKQTKTKTETKDLFEQEKKILWNATYCLKNVDPTVFSSLFNMQPARVLLYED